MPIYAYRCGVCGHQKDVLQKLSDPLLTTCPACGAEAYSKQLTAAGFQLKGSGWYVTDFKGGQAAAKSGGGAAAGAAAGEGGAAGGASPAADSGTSGGEGSGSGGAGGAAPAAGAASAAGGCGGPCACH